MTVADCAATRAVVLRAERLSRVVEKQRIVDDVSFDLRNGELLGLVGPSGSGKSSLLRLLNRLDEPSSGTVYLDQQDYRQISPRELRRRIGLVTQRPYLFPGDIELNVSFGPRQREERLSSVEVSDLLQRVGLPDSDARNVANLSGGEQQRVSLARSLANHPEILLLDEPTSALDEDAKGGIENLIRRLMEETSLTCVLVTHDRAQARRMCDRVVLLDHGRITSIGIPKEVLRA